MTVPAAAARIDVPVGAAMSMPSCIRPQRQPKPLVITPLTGQMKPLDERAVAGRAAAAAGRAADLLASAALCGLELVEVLLGVGAARPDAGEDALPVRAGRREGVLLRDELIACAAVCSAVICRKDRGLLRDLGLRQPRLLACDLGLTPGAG